MLLINKDALNWSKVAVSTFIIYIKPIEINAVILNFLFIKESWKKDQFPQKY